MKKLLANISLLFVVFNFILSINLWATEDKEVDYPEFSLTFNILQTLGYVAFTQTVAKDAEASKLIFIPLHVDMNLRLNSLIGLSMGVVYRYLDYGDKTGALYDSTGKVNRSKIWTDYHELFFMVGPTINPLFRDIEGLYVSAMAGLGTGFSEVYTNLSFILQPEVGFQWAFGTPGFFLKLGAGILFNVVVYEKIPFAAPKDHTFNEVNLLIHEIIPILNLGLGFNV